MVSGGLIWTHIASVETIDGSVFASFSCGETRFDDWLRGQARTAASRGECITHVCLDDFGMPVAFYTLSATSISSDDVSKSLQGGLHGSIPATLLGKMGVRTNAQGSGCGTRVLHHAMYSAAEAAKQVGSRLLVVDALTTDLVPWYEKRGFHKLPQSERRLVCKMSEVRKICSRQDDGYFVF